MKKIWNYLKWHFINDFDPGQYAVIGIFLVVALTLNYTFKFEDEYLERMSGYSKFLAYFLFYGLPYFFSVYVYSVFKKQKAIFLNQEFWIKSMFALFILSLDSSVPFFDYLINALFHPLTKFWGYKVLVNSIGFFTVLIPILLLYYLYEKKATNIYGLSAKKFDAAPYFTMLLIMLPVIIAASFAKDFGLQYPMYKSSQAHVHLGVPEWITVAIYETAYGLDFITVEYLFRGLMVIGMASLLGRSAVLSMAVVYCFLHFGKPAGEAVSSILGGYILGVIAYETKSIWGGIIVHMGIAWMMELVAFVQKNLSH
jgi:hypothetical protein